MNVENKKIAAVLVTFNRVELLKLAVESLKAQSFYVDEIIVVNNNSTDGTKSYLDGERELRSIHLPNNTGGAGGFHEGVKFAVTLDVDYIWIMDDDAIATKDALLELIKASEKIKNEWGFICSKVISDDNIFMSGPVISVKKNNSGYLNWAEYGEDGIIGVDKASFVSFFTQKKHVLKYGLPIKEMFIWGDDTEYSWRLSNQLDCYISCKSHVYHKRVDANALNIITESNLNRLNWYFYLYRNTFYNIKKHSTVLKIIKYSARCLVDIISIIIKAKDHRFRRVKIMLRGYLKGINFNPKVIFPKGSDDEV